MTAVFGLAQICIIDHREWRACSAHSHTHTPTKRNQRTPLKKYWASFGPEREQRRTGCLAVTQRNKLCASVCECECGWAQSMLDAALA